MATLIVVLWCYLLISIIIILNFWVYFIRAPLTAITTTMRTNFDVAEDESCSFLFFSVKKSVFVFYLITNKIYFWFDTFFAWFFFTFLCSILVVVDLFLYLFNNIHCSCFIFMLLFFYFLYISFYLFFFLI